MYLCTVSGAFSDLRELASAGGSLRKPAAPCAWSESWAQLARLSWVRERPLELPALGAPVAAVEDRERAAQKKAADSERHLYEVLILDAE